MRGPAHYEGVDLGPQLWRAHSACYGLDPQLFDYSPHRPKKAAEAAQVCAHCPVRNRRSELATPQSGNCETFHDLEQRAGMPLHTVAAGFAYNDRSKKPILPGASWRDDWPTCAAPLCDNLVTLAGDPKEQRRYCSYDCLVAARRAG